MKTAVMCSATLFSSTLAACKASTMVVQQYGAVFWHSHSLKTSLKQRLQSLECFCSISSRLARLNPSCTPTSRHFVGKDAATKFMRSMWEGLLSGEAVQERKGKCVCVSMMDGLSVFHVF